MNHIGTKSIETENLILRKWNIEDEVFKYFGEETKNTLIYLVEEYKKVNTYEWGIELKNNNKIIGRIYVYNQNKKAKSCEISYSIAKLYRNKGYATEALYSVLRFLINNVGYNIVECGCLIDNPASGKVMEKAGMKYLKTTSQNIYNCETGENNDEIIYRITKDDIKNVIRANCT